MSAIEPGMQVRVIVEGEVLFRAGAHLRVDTPDMYYTFYPSDPAVQVVPIDPDRPTLDLNSIAKVAQEAHITRSAEIELYLSGDGPDPGGPIWAHVANAIFALIDAAHPGLIR